MATLSGRTLNGNSGKQTYKYDGVIDSTINAGAGNDVFRLNFARNSTLNGDAGNDNIKIEWQKGTNKVRVNGGAGNDTIDVDGSVSTVDGGAGNDSISVKGSNWSVNGGAGNDTIQLWGWDTNLTVSGGAGKDTFLLMGPRYNDAGKPITATWATITDLSAEDTLRFAINPEVARSPYYAKGKKNPFYGKDGKISSLTATRSGSTVTLKDTTYRVNLVLKNINDLSRLGNVKVFNGSKAKKATTLRNLVTLPKLPKGIATKGSQLVIGNTFKGTFDFGKYFSWAKNINASSSKQKLTIKGDVQNNTITAGSAASVLYGLDGNDKLTGGKAADKLYGGAGNDNLNGGAGNDYLYGEAGNDTLTGGAGNDYLDGGAGNDVLTGGAGNDTFVYRNDGSRDTIKDYGQGTDTFYIASGTVSKTAVSGKNFVFTIGKGTATLTNAASKTVTVKTVGGTYTMNKTTLTAKSGFGGTLNGNFSTVRTVNGAAATKATILYGSSIANTVTGGSGNDKLYGYAGNDMLNGGKGNDSLDGGDGNDSLYGGDGADNLYGGSGNDTLYGGAGNDTFKYVNGNDIIFDYEEGKDVIRLAGEDMELVSAVDSGNDKVLTLSNGGKVTVKGAAGRSISYTDNSGQTQNLSGNVINGTENDDGLEGGDGNELIRGYMGSDKLYGNAGNDSLYGAGGYDWLEGGVGNDYLDGGEDNDKLFGGEGNDSLYGGEGNDSLLGDGYEWQRDGAGNDYLDGGAGKDTILGRAGDDTMTGGEGSDVFYYLLGDGNDVITDLSKEDYFHIDDSGEITNVTLKNNGKDVFLEIGENGVSTGSILLKDAADKGIGLNGNRIIDVTNRRLCVTAGGCTLPYKLPLAGIDTLDASGVPWFQGAELIGNDFANTIIGGDGDDTIYGLKGNDSILGGLGNDSLLGGEGNDSLDGDYGTNILTGGAGADVFFCGTNIETYTNTITDYTSGEDVLKFNVALTKSEQNGNDVVLTFENGSTTRLTGAAGKEITYEWNGETSSFVVNASPIMASSTSPMLIPDAAPIVGTSSAQLASLVSTTQVGTPGGLTSTGLASPKASGSSLIAAGGSAPSNPLTNQKTA